MAGSYDRYLFNPYENLPKFIYSFRTSLLAHQHCLKFLLAVGLLFFSFFFFSLLATISMDLQWSLNVV